VSVAGWLFETVEAILLGWLFAVSSTFL